MSFPGAIALTLLGAAHSPQTQESNSPHLVHSLFTSSVACVAGGFAGV